ncbi:unnamed protein product [Prorocentrum cordatum]|uniref:Ion transport domain-containing protein n=1 Tax=Prorocentrum cordatum TaxID=2364126 RepID=A0ABN9PEB8_9DINO|nr:unnamed protein product [Polarella glacialis]
MSVAPLAVVLGCRRGLRAGDDGCSALPGRPWAACRGPGRLLLEAARGAPRGALGAGALAAAAALAGLRARRAPRRRGHRRGAVREERPRPGRGLRGRRWRRPSGAPPGWARGLALRPLPPLLLPLAAPLLPGVRRRRRRRRTDSDSGLDSDSDPESDSSHSECSDDDPERSPAAAASQQRKPSWVVQFNDAGTSSHSTGTASQPIGGGLGGIPVLDPTATDTPAAFRSDGSPRRLQRGASSAGLARSVSIVSEPSGGLISEPSFASSAGASAAAPRGNKDDFATIKDMQFEAPAWLEFLLLITGVYWLQDAIQAGRAKRADGKFMNPFPLTYELVSDVWFEVLVAVIILLNCAYIGVVASFPVGEGAAVLDALEHVFVVFFVAEWCLRVAAFGWPWAFEFYNFLDTLLVFGTGVLVRCLAERCNHHALAVEAFQN